MKFESDRNTRAEQRVLSCLLRDADCLRHCAQIKANDFSHDAHGQIYMAIRTLIAHGTPVCIENVYEYLNTPRKRRFGAVSMEYLVTLVNMGAPISHVGYYAGAMLDLADAR